MKSGEYWVAVGRYDDGTEIEEWFPYNENGNYLKENERQYELEAWLVEQHEGCIYYSVTYECI